MGGKGRKRREKNYLAAHGAHRRLPPPPNASQVDALPFKLRKIMSFTSNSISLHNTKQLGGGGGHVDDKKFPPENTSISKANKVEEADDGDDKGLGGVADIRDEKRNKKGKRKRKQVNDLRFETSLEGSKSSQKKRERRKKYLEAKKNKKKNKNSNTEEENLDFPGREHVKFGDIVQAPPKLVTLPKALKNVPSASQERVRLNAIEAYRKHKGWTSRPGLQLPNISATPSL